LYISNGKFSFSSHSMQLKKRHQKTYSFFHNHILEVTSKICSFCCLSICLFLFVFLFLLKETFWSTSMCSLCEIKVLFYTAVIFSIFNTLIITVHNYNLGKGKINLFDNYSKDELFPWQKQNGSYSYYFTLGSNSQVDNKPSMLYRLKVRPSLCHCSFANTFHTYQIIKIVYFQSLLRTMNSIP